MTPSVSAAGRFAAPISRLGVAACAAFLCVGLGACAAGSEREPKAPEAEADPGDGQVGAPGDTLPPDEGRGEEPADDVPDTGEAPGEAPGTEDPGEEPDEEPDEDEDPPLPPGADLEGRAAERAAAEHLERAEAALRGDSRDVARAMDEAREALTVDEANLRAMLILAWAHYIEDNYDMAEQILDAAGERTAAQDHPRYHFIAGLVYDATDRAERAERAYERAVELAPGYGNALLNLGVHYLENRRYPEAIRVYERLTRGLDDERPAAWTNLGSAYRGRASELEGPRGDPDRRAEYLRRAEQAYERALSRDSDYAPAYYNLGILYLDADPFPGEDGDLETLERLRRADEYFDNYQRTAGADADRAEEQASAVSDLIEREERRIEREERRRERERRREERQ